MKRNNLKKGQQIISATSSVHCVTKSNVNMQLPNYLCYCFDKEFGFSHLGARTKIQKKMHFEKNCRTKIQKKMDFEKKLQNKDPEKKCILKKMQNKDPEKNAF